MDGGGARPVPCKPRRRAPGEEQQLGNHQHGDDGGGDRQQPRVEGFVVGGHGAILP